MEDYKLDSKYFEGDNSFNNMEKILNELTQIKPIKLSREEYNKMKGNFLIQEGENKFGKQYNLYLPDDLKVKELPGIISRINKATFGDKTPEYASKQELKVKITITISNLIELLSKKDLNTNEKEDIKKAIKKYIKLFGEMYGVNESMQLNNKNYRNKVIKSGETSINNDKFKEYEKKLINIKTKEKLNQLLSEIEEEMSFEIKDTFGKVLLDTGEEILRQGMRTITQKEQIEISKKEKNEGDEIYIHVEDEKLDEKERLLRDKIGIDKLKKDLDLARKSGNQEKINEAEINITNVILKNLYDFPYQQISSNNGATPIGIINNKEIYCVGFSLLGHAFLSELGIKHNVMSFSLHSALEIVIGKKLYYFDGTFSPKIHEFEYGTENGVYKKVQLKNGSNIGNRFAISGDSKKDLLSQIYNNKGLDFYKLGEYDKAIGLFNKSIKENPNYIDPYYNKGFSLFYMGKYEEAFEVFDTALKLFPIPKNYYDFGKLHIEKLGDFKKAISMFDKSLEIDSSNIEVYDSKGDALKEIGKGKSATLYKYAANLLKGENLSFEIFYREEKDTITDLISYNNFNGLRDYLLKLEKDEN